MVQAIICGRRGRNHSKAKLPPPAVVVPVIDREYVVGKYWTGPFRGRIVAISEMGSLIRFVVTDAMRPGPLIEEKCPFPECIAVEGHDGDHEFSEDLRNGEEIELRWSHVTLTPVEPVESTENVIRDLSSTKERRETFHH